MPAVVSTMTLQKWMLYSITEQIGTEKCVGFKFEAAMKALTVETLFRFAIWDFRRLSVYHKFDEWTSVNV